MYYWQVFSADRIGSFFNFEYQLDPKLAANGGECAHATILVVSLQKPRKGCLVDPAPVGPLLNSFFTTDLVELTDHLRQWFQVGFSFFHSVLCKLVEKLSSILMYTVIEACPR